MIPANLPEKKPTLKSGFGRLGFRKNEESKSKEKKTTRADAKSEKLEKTAEKAISERSIQGFETILGPRPEKIKGLYKKDITSCPINEQWMALASLPVNEQLSYMARKVIGDDGKIDVGMVIKLRKFLKINDPRHGSHVNRILDLLERDVKFQALIENVKAPGNTEGTETVKKNIRAMLYIWEDKEVTKVDAQRAVLISILSDLRQGDIESCYGTAIAICVHDCIPHLMVEDLTSMIEKGYFVRKGSPDLAQERFYVGEGFDFSDRTKFLHHSPEAILRMLNKLSIAYPEFKEIFEKVIALNNVSTSVVLDSIFDELAKHFEITKEDLEKEAELYKLSKKIRALSVEASLNEDRSLDEEVQFLIDDYDKKHKELGDKLLRLRLYGQTQLRLSRILFAEWNSENLLIKSWEYAILSAELREIERHREISSKKVPLMMRESFKEAIMNNDEGAIFVKEMDKILEKMVPLQDIFSSQQKEELSKFVTEILQTMKSVIDERITIRTVTVGKDETGHYLVYVRGEDVKKFIVLENGEEHAKAILGCMSEAFEKVFEKNQAMDKAIKKFLIKAKGMLGDQLQSDNFRSSLNCLVANSIFLRETEHPAYGVINRGHVALSSVSDIYFENKYSRNRLQIESWLSSITINPIFKQFLDWKGYREGAIVSAIEPQMAFVHFLRVLDGYVKNKQSWVGTSIGLMGICALGGFSWFVGGTIASLLAVSGIALTRRSEYKADAMDVLAHFIEASRMIYKSVSCHDEWVKYPIVVPAHVCNLLPFNTTMREIIESDEDVRQYIKRKVEDPERTIIAVIDTNHDSRRCYVGFQLGGGLINMVKLNSEFEVVDFGGGREFFNFAYMNENIYKVIDEKIKQYS